MGTTTAETFDVAAVVARMAATDVPSASAAELAWADRAADRVRSWVDAWQAQVRFESTLPRPLPPAADAADEAASAGAATAEDVAADHTAEGLADAAGSEPDRDGGGCPSAPDELPSLGSDVPAPESAAEQARKERRSWLLSCLAAFAEALRAGRITTGHVDALAAVADRLPAAVQERLLARGDELLRSAIGMTVDGFARALARVVSKAYEDEGIDRQAAQRARAGLRRGVDPATKMHWYRIELDPDRGVVLDAQLQAERNALFHRGGHAGLRSDQLELHAFLNLVGAAGSGPVRGEDAVDPVVGEGADAVPAGHAHLPADAGGAPPAPAAPRRWRRAAARKVRGLVLIDATTWLEGIHDGTVCENGAGVPLPPETVRRLLCIAELTYGITVNGRLVAQVVANELATPAQRDGLRGMYRTCAGPGCTRPFDHCQIHHIIARARHGPTDLALMIPLCSAHHDAIHHRGWQVAIEANRDLTWTPPQGRVLRCPFVPLAELDRIPDATEQLDLFARPSPAA